MAAFNILNSLVTWDNWLKIRLNSLKRVHSIVQPKNMLEFSTIREKMDIYFNFQFLHPFSIFCCIIHICWNYFVRNGFHCTLHLWGNMMYLAKAGLQKGKMENMEKMCPSLYLGIFTWHGAFKSRFGYLDILKV